MKIRETCWNTLDFDPWQCREHILFQVSWVWKRVREKPRGNAFASLPAACAPHQKSREQNGSQDTLSFLPARSHVAFSIKGKVHEVHSFIFIASPEKFSTWEPYNHSSCPANLVHCSPFFDTCSFIQLFRLGCDLEVNEWTCLSYQGGTTVFATICLSEEGFYRGETFMFQFMTSYTWWETNLHLHLPSWHTSATATSLTKEETDGNWHTASAEQIWQGKHYPDRSLSDTWRKWLATHRLQYL